MANVVRELTKLRGFKDPVRLYEVGWRETGVYLEVNYWKRNQHFLRRSGQSEA